MRRQRTAQVGGRKRGDAGGEREPRRVRERREGTQREKGTVGRVVTVVVTQQHITSHSSPLHPPPLTYLHTARPREAVDGLRYPVARLHLPVQGAEGRQCPQERLAAQCPHHPALLREHVHLAPRLDHRIRIFGDARPHLAVQVRVQGDGHLGVADALGARSQPGALPALAATTHLHQTGAGRLVVHDLHVAGALLDAQRVQHLHAHTAAVSQSVSRPRGVIGAQRVRVRQTVIQSASHLSTRI